MQHQRVAWGIRIFARVQRLLPLRYRQRHGADAEALFARLATEAYDKRGTRGVVTVLARALFDLATRVPIEHTSGPYAPRSVQAVHALDASPERSRPFMHILRSLRHALRMLRREPRHAVTIIITLAMAIGATTAIGAVADAVLIRPLPYADASNVYHMATTYSGARTDASLSYPDFVDVVANTPSLAEHALYRSWGPTLTGDGEPSAETGALVSSTFFSLLRLRPALGRFFTAEEDVHGNDAVVVLSWGFWQRRFGGANDIVGRTIDVDGSPHVVVGVGPAEFAQELPAITAAAIFRPLGYVGAPSEDLPSRGNESYQGLARLRAGVSVAQANAEIARVMAANAAAYPASNTGQGLVLEPLREASVRSARPALLVFLVAGAVVLLIAITNVVNLMLARTSDRRHDLATRAALGANRAQLSLLLVAESFVLALVGGALGLGLSVFLTRVLVSRAGDAIPLSSSLLIDGRVLALSAALTLLAGVATGLAAGLYSTRGDLQRALIEAAAGRGTTAGRRTSRVRRGLVLAQVALCVMLVICASLLLRSLHALVRVDPGFDTGVTAFRVNPPAGRFPSDADVLGFYDRVMENVRAIPGVERAATIGAMPLSRISVCGTLFAEEDPNRFDGQDMCAEVRPISPGYFGTMGIPLQRGRDFTAGDDSLGADVGLVSEGTANLLWPGQDPIGKRFATGLTEENGFRLFSVIGVVPNIKQFSLDERTPPQTYLPAAQWAVRARSVVVRSAVPTVVLFPALRNAVWAVDDRVPVTRMAVLSESVERTLVSPRFRTLLIGACAVLALALAVVGLYGVIAGSVARRRGELAIRMSLGAEPARVLRLVLVEGGRLAMIGVGIGLAGAFAASRLLAGLLYGVSALDPLAFVGAPVIVLIIAALAVLVPAIRATRVDPLESLRQ
jgi:putative ABC transport system permease protein